MPNPCAVQAGKFLVWAKKMPKEQTVFSEDTSLVFKETRVLRLWDEAKRTLVYLAISRKLIDGAPANSIATVPVRPWAAP